MWDVPGQVWEEFGGDGAVEPFDLPSALRDADPGVDELDVRVQADAFEPGGGEVGAVVAVEHVGQAADGPGGIRFAVDGLVQGKRCLFGGGCADEEGVAGGGAGVVVQYPGQPGPCRGAVLVEDRY